MWHEWTNLVYLDYSTTNSDHIGIKLQICVRVLFIHTYYVYVCKCISDVLWICILTYTYICMHGVWVGMCMSTNGNVWISKRACVYVYLYMCVYLYVCMYMRVYVHVRVCVTKFRAFMVVYVIENGCVCQRLYISSKFKGNALITVRSQQLFGPIRLDHYL